jgi:hypothetical protein
VAPTVGFVLVLPPHWNGRFLELGCGGFCGTNYFGWEFFSASEIEKIGRFSGPLKQGYAMLAVDGGHAGDVHSALWAFNNLQGQLDFGVRAPHVAALAGKAIVRSYYGEAPKKSYFWGCSSGGQQALSEAQRFPWDFDGILAGAPSPTFSGPMVCIIYGQAAHSQVWLLSGIWS